MKAQLFVTNDTMKDVKGRVEWSLRGSDGRFLKKGTKELAVPALSTASLDEIDFKKTDVRSTYLSFSYSVDNKVVSTGTVIFTKPKHFRFTNPELAVNVDGDTLIVKSRAYAKYVYIANENDDLILSDNFFDMEAGEKRIKILSGDATNLSVCSVYDIK
jgi:beta-mannosidase